MSAVDIIDQMRELIMRDCLLIMFEDIPPRFATEDTDVVGGVESQRKERPQERPKNDEWLRNVKSLNR